MRLQASNRWAERPREGGLSDSTAHAAGCWPLAEGAATAGRRRCHDSPGFGAAWRLAAGLGAHSHARLAVPRPCAGWRMVQFNGQGAAELQTEAAGAADAAQGAASRLGHSPSHSSHSGNPGRSKRAKRGRAMPAAAARSHLPPGSAPARAPPKRLPVTYFQPPARARALALALTAPATPLHHPHCI